MLNDTCWMARCNLTRLVCHVCERTAVQALGCMPPSVRVQGTGEDVPCHLRAEGLVRNRRIGRVEVNKLISGFWQHRLTTQDPSEPVSTCMDTGQGQVASLAVAYVHSSADRSVDSSKLLSDKKVELWVRFWTGRAVSISHTNCSVLCLACCHSIA